MSSLTSMEKLIEFLKQLEERRMHFSLGRFRDQTVAVFVSVPGQRWEVEFFADGNVEVEVFKSDGDILPETSLDDLLARFSDN